MDRIRTLLLALSVSCSLSTAHAAFEPATPFPADRVRPGASVTLDLTEIGKSYRSKGASAVQARVIFPDDFDPKRPMPVVLHLGGGAGGIDGADRWKKALNGRRFIFAAVDYWQDDPDITFSPYQSGPKVARHLLAILGRAVVLDESRILLTGESSGAYSITTMLSRNDTSGFTGFMCIIGGTEFPPAKLRDRPILFVAGENDTQRASLGEPRVDAQRVCHETVTRARGDSTLIIQKGVGHSFSSEYYDEVARWMVDKMFRRGLPRMLVSLRSSVRSRKWPKALATARDVIALCDPGMAERKEAEAALERATEAGREEADRLLAGSISLSRLIKFARTWPGCPFTEAVTEAITREARKKLDSLVASKTATRFRIKPLLKEWRGLPAYDLALAVYDDLAKRELAAIANMRAKTTRTSRLRRFVQTWTPAPSTEKAREMIETMAAEELEIIKKMKAPYQRKAQLRALMRTYKGTEAAQEAAQLLK